jgi:hypothetical protein
VSGAAISTLAFGAYLCSGGLLLLLAPNQVCRLLSMAPPQGAWIRIVGMLFLILAFYCWRAAREENIPFIRWTVYTRPTTILFLLWFVARGWIEPVVLIFGVVDVAATIWTFVTINGGRFRGTGR